MTMHSLEFPLMNLADPENFSVRQAVQKGAELLSLKGVASARLDAELLLAHALGYSRERLYLNYELSLGTSAKNCYSSLIERRARREPLAYITERREFWSLDFFVSPDVLVPRPETELLVELTLGLAVKLGHNRAVKILDLGTGSGAIAVSLAKELRDAEIWATDLSAKALPIARANALRHGMKEKIRFLQGNAFGPVKDKPGFFHAVVANPPYVREDEFHNLPPEVRDWEPRLALAGGMDGLDLYRHIVEEAHLYLVDGGYVALEIGAEMGAAVSQLFSGVGCYSSATVAQDYAGKDRVVAAQKLPFHAIY